MYQKTCEGWWMLRDRKPVVLNEYLLCASAQWFWFKSSRSEIVSLNGLHSIGCVSRIAGRLTEIINIDTIEGRIQEVKCVCNMWLVCKYDVYKCGGISERKQADRNLMYSKSEGLPPSYTTALKQAYPGVGSGYKDERFTRARRHHIWQRNIFDPNETGSIKAGWCTGNACAQYVQRPARWGSNFCVLGSRMTEQNFRGRF